MTLEELVKELEYAKKAVQTLLNNADSLVDMHGIGYWANRLEDIRKGIKEML